MPIDPTTYASSGSEQSAGIAESISPADTDLTRFTRALYIGGTGNVTVIMAEESIGGGTTVITFSNVPAGTILPLRVAQVRLTGTTATNIIALF